MTRSDENGIGSFLFDASLQDLLVRHEQVVADQLGAGTDLFGECRPTGPVGLIHSVFHRNERELIDEICQECNHFL